MVNPYINRTMQFRPEKKGYPWLCFLPVITESREEVMTRLKEWAKGVSVIHIEEFESGTIYVHYRDKVKEDTGDPSYVPFLAMEIDY